MDATYLKTITIFSYWENNKVTSDEKDILLYLNNNNLINNKNIFTYWYRKFILS